MSASEASLDERISRLGQRPRFHLDGMISIREIAKVSSINHISDSPSIGAFDLLPLELLHRILELLDFRSLSHLSRVSLQGNEVVKSLPAYRDFMAHGPDVLVALVHTGLIVHHSASTLYHSLRQPKCTSCGEYGAFLFLLTCERCCNECLRDNQSLWAVPWALARKCFGLTLSQVKRLPTLRSIPGVYSTGKELSRQRRYRLVSVKAAMALGIAIHGSLEELKQALERRRSKGMTMNAWTMQRWLLYAPLQPSGRKPFINHGLRFPRADQYHGTASLAFPSLMPNNHIENGIWCRGCDRMFSQCCDDELDLSIVPHLVAPGGDPIFVLAEMRACAWSKAGFLEHITQCHGAQELEANPDDL